MKTPKDKILMIIERLGMSGVKAADVMNITDNTFRKNKMESVATHNFTEKNFTDLLDFLIRELKFLITVQEDGLGLNMYDLVTDKINHIFEKYPEYRKQEKWNLFNELKLVVDFMENGEIFEDIKLYEKIISYIIERSKSLVNEPNAFTIDRYDDYVHKDRINNHTRWHNLIVHIRNEKIRNIIK